MVLFPAFLLTLLIAGPAFAQSAVKPENVGAELVSEAAMVKPGEPFWVGLRQTIRPHWHTYWKNPGDSGLPTEIAWTLPAGVVAAPLLWPPPTTIHPRRVINYCFGGGGPLRVQNNPPAAPPRP